MNNRFLTAVITFIQGTLAKSADVNTAFSEVGAGFDAVQDEMNVALRGPATEKATNMARLPAAGARASKWVAFDATGAPIATMTLPADMDAGGHRLRNLIAPAANDEPVTLGYLTAYSGALAGIPPLAGNNGKFLTTDGVGVQWTFGGAPSTVTTENGLVIVSNAGTPVWTALGYNLLTDPQGIYGAESWTVDADRAGSTNTGSPSRTRRPSSPRPSTTRARPWRSAPASTSPSAAAWTRPAPARERSAC
jgi:cell division septation protein DedD